MISEYKITKKLSEWYYPRKSTTNQGTTYILSIFYASMADIDDVVSK